MIKNYNQEEESEAKFNAGIDAEKRIMELFREIDKVSLIKNGQAQEAKYIIIKQLCIASRGMFTKKEVRAKIWDNFMKIKLNQQIVSIKQGQSKTIVVYDSKIDLLLDMLLILITDYLQDERGFFSPAKGELSLF